MHSKHIKLISKLITRKKGLIMYLNGYFFPHIEIF